MLSGKLRSLQILSKRVCKSERSVFDIVLFGSSIKEKRRPEDVDICIILSQDLKQPEIKRISDSLRGYHVEHLLLSELYTEPLWQTIIHEGLSLTHNKPLHEILGFSSQLLFTYNLERLSPVRKSVFSHALFGRSGTEGVLKEAKGKALGRGCILVPVETSEKIREFLDTWGVDYSVMKALIS